MLKNSFVPELYFEYRLRLGDLQVSNTVDSEGCTNLTYQDKSQVKIMRLAHPRTFWSMKHSMHTTAFLASLSLNRAVDCYNIQMTFSKFYTTKFQSCLQLCSKRTYFSSRHVSSALHRCSAHSLVSGDSFSAQDQTQTSQTSTDLAFSSAYVAADGLPRGFCNWLLPGRIMAGRYPHGTPFGSKTGSPSIQVRPFRGEWAGRAREHRYLFELGAAVLKSVNFQ